MSKLNFTTVSTIALLSLGATFAAHAQSAHDPIDSAAYGPQFTAAPANAANATATATAAVSKTARNVLATITTPTRAVSQFDTVDHAAYGPMPVTASNLTRAQVRAEVLATRASGERIADVEGGDVVVAQHPLRADTNRVLAGNIDKNVK